MHVGILCSVYYIAHAIAIHEKQGSMTNITLPMIISVYSCMLSMCDMVWHYGKSIDHTLSSYNDEYVLSVMQ
jgi:hypothetical protein